MPRILVVDDDPNVGMMLSDVLRDEGHEVAVSTRSLAALGQAKEFRPDLILLDLMMPHLDGLDQLRLMALDEELRRVPVIVVTAATSMLERLSADDLRTLRLAGTVQKPFDLAELLAKIDAALEGHAAV